MKDVGEIRWKDIRDKQSKFEISCLIGMVTCIAVGIAGEVIVKLEMSNLSVLNFDAVSLVLLQIQATIGTLTIALLALLGSRITDSYMGINYNDFQLNFKPVLFKQKRIVLGSIISLAGNVFLHMAGLYNLVTSVFIMECIAILVSARQIYDAFTKNERMDKEIKSYLEWDFVVNRCRESFDNLHNGWKKSITQQPQSEYEIYLNIFRKFFERELLNSKENARSELQEKCTELIILLLESDKEDSMNRGIKLLNEFYRAAFICINDNTELAKKFSDGFHLFNHIYEELREAIRVMPVNLVEQCLEWKDLEDYVVLINSKVNKDDESITEINALYDFSSFLGYYISSKRDQERNDSIWGEPLRHMRCYLSVDESSKQMVYQQKARLIFVYGISLIRFNMLDLLKDNLYKRAIRYAETMNSKYYAYMVLKLHCYIYYIAEYEEPVRVVSPELKEACKSFLEEEDVKSSFTYFLHWVTEIDEKILGSSECEETSVFNQNLEKELFESLRFCEMYPKYENGKRLIMDTVVKNFTTFLILYTSNRYYVPDLLQKTIQDKEIIAYYQEYATNDWGYKIYLRLLGSSPFLCVK